MFQQPGLLDTMEEQGIKENMFCSNSEDLVI